MFFSLSKHRFSALIFSCILYRRSPQYALIFAEGSQFQDSQTKVTFRRNILNNKTFTEVNLLLKKKYKNLDIKTIILITEGTQSQRFRLQFKVAIMFIT